jgi:hypothetical protein
VSIYDQNPDTGLPRHMEPAGGDPPEPTTEQLAERAYAAVAPYTELHPETAISAQCFAAFEAIKAGAWDKHLAILAGAIRVRQRELRQASPPPHSGHVAAGPQTGAGETTQRGGGG